ncbi:gamma-glutamylcyclotransferase [Paenactinomyces guangxiensis]|uniref:Gamma-glutamylcyclotransferase n=1 Tax=Paenactinomyces guangxiensis TaxID=1490290 RepID=A0A7W1WUG0_9BACL|nr:gamma-glutamylcyclotransferase [Paenactinomyces guangxiensis]MBA4496270.1 gamma-glutamylcyclotransferase [Paenactinomyces guangxiensis]MBH8593323.1 gamma-glutamylcyclotransferase [Paenactinomyces guangxiensis]
MKKLIRDLFVYGSLRKGMKYSHYLKGAALVGRTAWIRGELYDTGEGYPGLIQGKGKVYGEIYHIDGRQLKKIDALEDYFGPDHHLNLYERITTEVYTPGGAVQALVYFYRDQDQLKKNGIWIPSGDWRQYRG